jgi:curved DNA-binding protein CbpA
MTKTDYFMGCTSLDEARKMYYRLAMKFHPDKGGDEELFKDLVNQFHSFKPSQFKYEKEFDDWSSQAFSAIIEALMEIPDLTIEICGSWIWISGKTREYKDRIKSIKTNVHYKRGFSAKKKLWYFSPEGYRKKSADELDMESIRNIYGTEELHSPSQKAVKDRG